MNEFTLLAETTWADGWVAIIQATISAIVTGLTVLIPIFFLHRASQRKVDAGVKQVQEVKRVVDFQTERMADAADIEVKKQKAAKQRGDNVNPEIARDIQKLADTLETESVASPKTDKPI